MKKFFVFLVLVGGIAAAVYFYDPYLKPHLDPLVEKVAGKSPEKPGSEGPGDPEEATPAGGASGKPTVAPSSPATPASPQAPSRPAAPPVSEIDRVVEQRYPMPEFIPLSQIVNNWTAIPQRAFPSEVTIRDRVPFSLRDSGGKVIGASVATPGTLVKPVRIQGSNLIVASLANNAMQSQISVDKTDLKERIEKRYNDSVLAMTNRVRTQREKAKQALLAKPDALAALKASEGAAFDASGDPRFAPVKASLSQGKVTAFNLDEAVAFRWNGSEKIDGDVHKGTFDTVTVKYEARTIFGVFPGEAKCLIQSGRVIGWIDPITEEEMI